MHRGRGERGEQAEPQSALTFGEPQPDVRQRFLVIFAERLRRVGRHDQALAIVALGLMRGESQGAHWGDAELHRVHARTLLDRGDAEEEAEARLLLGLRAAMDLARLWQRRGKRAEARALLAPLHASSTEGFELQDLRDAEALLNELA